MWLWIGSGLVVLFGLGYLYARLLDDIPSDYDGEDLFTLDDDERDA